jgi:hypothetical protein
MAEKGTIMSSRHSRKSSAADRRESEDRSVAVDSAVNSAGSGQRVARHSVRPDSELGQFRWTLSIDVGAVHTAAAVRLPDGTVAPVRLGAHTDWMPSEVFLDGNVILTGVEAARARSAAPERVISSPKQWIARGAVEAGETEVAAAQPVAAVLRHAAIMAMAKIGAGPPAQLILTHPLNWVGEQLARLAHAARLAGLPSPLLVPEPIAAAAWFLRPRPLPVGDRVVVLDVGVDSCDLTVLRVDPAAAFGLVVEEQMNERWHGEPAGRRSGPALSEQATDRITVDRAAAAPDSAQRQIDGAMDQALALLSRANHALYPLRPVGFCLVGSLSLAAVGRQQISAALGWSPIMLDDPRSVTALGALVAGGDAAAARGTAAASAPARSRRNRGSATLGGAFVALVAAIVMALINHFRPWDAPPDVQPAPAATSKVGAPAAATRQVSTPPGPATERPSPVAGEMLPLEL